MRDNAILIREMRSGSIEARNELVEKNMGLVYSVVKRFFFRGYEFEDLVQIGSIGLIKAAQKFDPNFNVQFSTYAVPMIAGEIRRFLRDDGMIKISRSLKETAMRGWRTEELLRKRLNREPTLAEISRESGVELEDLLAAYEAVSPPESIYNNVYSNGSSDIKLVDMLCGGNAEEKIINRVMVSEIMSELSERERKILIMRYFRDKTQSEVAKEFGVSQVQISRIEKKAMDKIRAAMPQL